MPDFSNPVVLTESIGLAVILWAWFFIWSPMRARKAGVAYEEPPVWLYSGGFDTLQIVSLVALVAAGAYLQPGEDIMNIATDRMSPVILALVDVALAGGALTALSALFLRWKSRESAVVIEPMTAGEIFLSIIIGIAIVAALILVPVGAGTFLNIDLVDMLVGGMRGGGGAGSASADLGIAAGLLLIYVFFWLIPEMIARIQEIDEGSPVWGRASGLVLFRWWWLGLTLVVTTGILGVIPGTEGILTYPVPIAIAVAVPIVGAIIFLLFWVVPQRKLVAIAATGDYLAKEMLPNVRFSGIAAYSQYKTQIKTRPRNLANPDEQRLCPSCLRPTNDIRDYKTMQFDHCPHCGAFIPPLFSIQDFIKYQATRLQPLLEEAQASAGQPAGKKRHRTEDERALVQELLRALLKQAVEERGTDLHLIVEDEKMLARCRTDGVLYTMAEFDKIVAKPLISATKVMANLDITERRKPQDGSFKVEFPDQIVDVRVNTSPVMDGEMAAMRLLYVQDVLGSLEKLGMAGRSRGLLTRVIQQPNGMILTTGPTGSGKSTTLYNCLQTIATGQRNIITLEDPIEYQIKGLTQMQINQSKGFTFATGLRSILRQDPDVIMVGEIRDGETAKMVGDAAATGHLVFSTLHATDTLVALDRLKDLGVDSRRVAEVTLLIMAQRLIRTICPKCTETYIVTKEDLEAMGLDDPPRDKELLGKGRGCQYCHDSGYRGREGIYELFHPNNEVKELINSEASTATIRQMARANGMRTLLEDGLVKVLTRRTTVEELLRVTR